jgi:hypothetical protein
MKVSELIRILQNNKEWAEKDGKPEQEVYILLRRDVDPHCLKKWEGKWPRDKFIELIGIADTVWAYDNKIVIYPGSNINYDGRLENAEEKVQYTIKAGDVVIEASKHEIE